VLGTAPYVSPEQLRDKGVTGASDLYSLGAVAYECLTGTPPFDAADPAAVIHGHLYSEPPALPADVPVEVAGIVSRSLSKSPEERWESGDVLAAAARAATTGQHSLVTPPAFPAPVDGNAAEASTADVPLPAGQPPFVPPVTPPSQPAEPPAEEPRRRRLVLIGLAAVLALTVIAVVALNPFSGDGKVADGDDDTSPTTSASTSEAGSAAAQEPSSSTSASPTESAASAEEEPEDDGGGSEPEGNTSGGNEDEGADEPMKEGSGPVPDVRGGTTFDARDQLNGEGFSNVVAQVGYYYIVPEPEHCTVIDQSPAAGETADYSGQITVYFHERTAEGTSCLL
jgi:serine/threonine-protein kinase